MSNPYALNIMEDSLKPTYRRLRGYAFDPSFSNELDSSNINSITYPIRWEGLRPGPIGEYLEVLDVDPASSVFYPPINLEDPQLLAQDGLPPSESNPQFHQQMVYAVAMLTIQNFEKALGRRVQWSSKDFEEHTPEKFVRRLRLYPHAFRGANAYYSSQKKAVLFGYFSARPIVSTPPHKGHAREQSSHSTHVPDQGRLMPGSLVFSCLSHDIIAHEVTHALIDGIHKRLILPVHEDTLAVHEALSDIVALFQHFTFPEILENQISRTRGDLSADSWLSQLARQFGLAIGQYGSLRDAISVPPDPQKLATIQEPHQRGSFLVAAMFDAFLSIYKRNTIDLYRIATEGRGVLPEGEIHPDLVKRLASEASRTARQFLSLFIRAFDYCPPVGTTFGDLLRAMITADVDLVKYDPLNYRIALIGSFKQWGIYPEGIRTLSVENLTHDSYNETELIALANASGLNASRVSSITNDIHVFRNFMRDYFNNTAICLEDRKELFNLSLHYRIALHDAIEGLRRDGVVPITIEGKKLLQSLTGILFVKNDYDDFVARSLTTVNAALDKRTKMGAESMHVKGIRIELNKNQNYKFEIHSLNRAQRIGPEYNVVNQVILTIMQRCVITVELTDFTTAEYEFRGGSTLITDIDKKTIRIVHKGIMRRFHNEISAGRLADELLRRFSADVTEGESSFALSNWPESTLQYEPFSMLHRHL